MNLNGVRRRLARWIYPEGAGTLQPETPSPRTAELLRLAEAFVRHHGFAELTHQAMLDTFYEWAGCKRYDRHDYACRLFRPRWLASNTITRLLKHPSVCPRPETYHRVIQTFSRDWPSDLKWPADIPRPAPQPPRPDGHPSRGCLQDVGGRAASGTSGRGEQLPTHPYRDVGGRAASGTKADPYRDVGGRAASGTKAESAK